MKDLDVTDKVDFGYSNNDFLSLLKCVCGQEFEGWSDAILSYDKDDYFICPSCKRKLYFDIKITIFEER